MDSSESTKNRKGQGHRRRKEEIANNYICGDQNCAKKYGTNAALYTHIKNKHSGEEPPNTKRPEPSGTKGQKGRPKQEDHSEPEVPDDNVGCCLCLKQKCQCPEQFDPRLIKILSETQFINLIKTIGSFGESKRQEELNNVWVRNVDDEMTTIKEEQIKDEFAQFCREKAHDAKISNNLVSYLAYASRFWNKGTIEELYRGIFIISMFKNQTQIAAMIKKDEKLPNFDKQIEISQGQFTNLIEIVNKICNTKDEQ